MGNTPTPATINWKLLLRRLERQKAVLLLGPEVPMATQREAQSMKHALQEHVQRDLSELLQEYDLRKIEYYQEDGFFHLEDDYKADIVYPIIDFFRQLSVTEAHRKLVQLPFHMILSLSPDDLIVRAMQELDLPHRFHYYDKRKYNKEHDSKVLDFTPSLNKRLVYNIFGTLEEEDSLILSYDDLFEFVQKIFNNYDLPEVVRETILNADCFVFIGFDYSKWYLKLLLRLMNLQQKVKLVYGMDAPFNQEIETFFINEFDMNFTRLHTLDFIDQLYDACAEVGLLIEPGHTTDTDKLDTKLKEQTAALIRKDKLDAALTNLLRVGENGQLPDALYTDLIHLSGRYQTLRHQNAKGILAYAEYTLQHNRITDDLLTLLNLYG